jgi:putative transcriptional regulator
LRFALLLAVAACAGFAQPRLGPGTILVADRDLSDPNFANSVVLLVEATEQGALGLIVNRRSEILLSQALESFPAYSKRRDRLHQGGPVQPESILGLLRAEKPVEGSARVARGIWFLKTRPQLEAAAGAEAADLRVFSGYAGWGPGQLENELRLGGWHVIGGEAGLAFDEDPAGLWSRLVRRTESRIAGGRWPGGPSDRAIAQE